MKSGASIIAESIERAVDYKLARSTRPKSKTVTGTYLGKDGEGKAWVRLSGAEGAIPIRRMSVQADVGDTVSVTVGGGRAVIDSNVSNPSASSSHVAVVGRRAIVAQETAVKAVDYAVEASAASAAARASANGAQISAEKAHVAAENAEADAIRAHNAADEAMAEAVRAHDAADEANESALVAQNSANEAINEAARANRAANDAFVQLGNVEDVIDTLGWFASHTTQTSDETVDPKKNYYYFDGSSYSSVETPSNEDMRSYPLSTDVHVDPEKVYYTNDYVAALYRLTLDMHPEVEKTYYTYSYEDDQYVHTFDEELVSGKTYYVLEDGEYVAVEDPDVTDIVTYYELIPAHYEYLPVENPTDEGMHTYALTSDEEPVSGKTYYVLEDGEYVVVEEPSSADISTYYERTVHYYELIPAHYEYSPVENPTDEGLCTYALTSDEEPVSGKTYYVLEEGEYLPVENPTDEGMRTYALTSDEEPVSGKTYYVLEDGEYVVVEEPSSADISTYYERTVHYYEAEVHYHEQVVNYYELDTTIQNYVASHIALTDEGLFLVMDDSDMRLKLDSAGVYVTNAEGHEVASFTDTGVHFDSELPQRVGGDNAYVKYYDSDDDGRADAIEVNASVITLDGNDVSTVLGGIENKLTTVVEGLEQSSYFTQTENGFSFSVDSAIENAMLAADDARRVATDYLTYKAGELIVGTSGSEIKAVLTNSRFAFVADATDMATFGLKQSYVQTSDNQIDPSKTYYVLSGGRYLQVEEPSVSDISTYYEMFTAEWEMHIANTFVDDMLRFGDFAWIKRDNGNMSLKWLG